MMILVFRSVVLSVPEKAVKILPHFSRMQISISLSVGGDKSGRDSGVHCIGTCVIITTEHSFLLM